MLVSNLSKSVPVNNFETMPRAASLSSGRAILSIDGRGLLPPETVHCVSLSAYPVALIATMLVFATAPTHSLMTTHFHVAPRTGTLNINVGALLHTMPTILRLPVNNTIRWKDAYRETFYKISLDSRLMS